MLTDVTDTTIRTTQNWSQLAIPGGAGAAGGLSTGEYALLPYLVVLLGRPEEAPGDFAAIYEQLDARDRFSISSVPTDVGNQTHRDDVARTAFLCRDRH
ncbi:hypothetical protein [Corynebacterium kalidii]|uniref:Uncharacterized protein n=1 Tax=Corynebacterium kalidii TaxID=2931982 RepID=A0A9X1WLX8_9CORY|nr:hypothetical protein [Corynebacterium kalidii]MCJ7858962.1 hypothetical protein [Corynebacterium kalidii]